MKQCVGRLKKTQGVFMTKFTVGEQELTHEELMSKVGSGHIPFETYQAVIAAHNEGAVVDVKPAKKGKTEEVVEDTVEETTDADSAQS